MHFDGTEWVLLLLLEAIQGKNERTIMEKQHDKGHFVAKLW